MHAIPLLITFGLVALILGVVYLFGRSNLAKQTSRLDQMTAELAQLLQATPGKLTVPSSKIPVTGFEVQREGHRVQIFAAPIAAVMAVQVRVLADKPLPFLMLRPENWRDRLGKTLFLNREVQTGDPEFDSRFYIETDESEDVVRAALGDVKARTAISNFLTARQAMVLSEGGLSMTAGVQQKLTLEQLDGGIKQLAAVLDAIPATPGAVGKYSGAPGDLLPGAMWLVWAAFYMLFFVVFLLRPDGWGTIDRDAQKTLKHISQAGFLLYLPASFLYVRGYSRSLRNFVFPLFPALLVFLTAPDQLLSPVNALFDTHAPAKVDGVVMTKHETGSKFRQYWLKFDVGHSNTMDLVVPQSQQRAAKIGDAASLFVKPGAFGWRWVDHVELNGPAPKPSGSASGDPPSGSAPAR